MAAAQDGGKRRRRRHLTPQEKYQVWQEVVAGQGTQREIADRWGIDTALADDPGALTTCVACRTPEWTGS